MSTSAFQGWQRKSAIVTIVISLVFVGGWIRSYTVSEEIVVLVSGRLHAFLSASGGLSWVSWSDGTIPQSFEWEINSAWSNGNAKSSWSSGMMPKGKSFQWSDTVWQTTTDKSRFWIIKYWQIAVPLTLLSASLLVTKPRTPKQENR